MYQTSDEKQNSPYLTMQKHESNQVTNKSAPTQKFYLVQEL